MDLTTMYFRLPPFVRNAALSGYGFWQARKRFDRGFMYRYGRLMQSQWRDVGETQQWQMEQLARLLEHACNHVPYYQRVFAEAGISPSDITSVEDLTKIPLLTRESVASRFEDLCSDEMRAYRPVFCKTSGSTGQKLRFYLPSELKWGLGSAVLWRFYSWGGVKPGDRRATLGARVFTVRPPYWAWNKWENQLLLSSHHLYPENLREYCALLRRFRVVFIQGHPSAIRVLAEHVLQEGRPIPMKAVFTTGETIYDDDRVLIEKAFECDVLDSYGMGERAAEAQECAEHAGYHEVSEDCVIEMQPAGNGLYEIVGTSLLNFAMPFIRYRTGDLVQPTTSAQCKCRRGLPIRFTRVIGRVDDSLIFAGRTVLPVTVRMFMKPLLVPGENYRVIQEDETVVKVELTGSVSALRAARIREEFRAFVPEQVVIEVEHVDDLIGSNNKVRNVVNRLRLQERVTNLH
ncbi:MAG: phenylacetate--CoA ligase family protein [Firmicutes bacterium]|nr:phenylacetate--CoA ligase family protein [Bacillota bacterium]